MHIPQVETGSAITWKYPSVVLAGDNSIGEFYSVALTNNKQQVCAAWRGGLPRAWVLACAKHAVFCVQLMSLHVCRKLERGAGCGCLGQV